MYVVVVTQAHIGNTQKRLVFDVVIQNCGRRCIGLSMNWLFQVFCDDMVSFFSSDRSYSCRCSFLLVGKDTFQRLFGIICRPMIIGYCSMWRCILNLFVLHFAHKSLILAMATEWCYVLLKIWYSFVDPCNYLRLFSLVSCYLEVLSFYLVTLYLRTMS